MTDTNTIQSSVAHLEGKARQRVVMRDMQRRMVKHLADGATTDMAPGVMQVDAAIFTDPARLDAEKRELFLTLPMLAGLSCDLPKPGDFLVFEALGPSILVVRGRDGRVRAFLNRCPHRAAKITEEACGHRRTFTCPFHGWTHDTEGKLIGLPGAAAFEGLDPASLDLTPVPVGEWAGLIFVKGHAGDETIDVEAFLGPLAAEMKQLGLADTVPVRKSRIDLDANWKFAQDTFFEGYHFNTIHPTTIAAHAVGNVAIHDEFGPHQRVIMPQKFFLDWVGRPESDWGEIPYQGIHLIFPSTIFFSGHMEGFGSNNNSQRQIFGIWRCYPGETPGKAFSLMATYRPAEENSETDIKEYEDLTNFILTVIETEDYSLCKQGQENLESSAPGHKVLFGRNEPALQSIHRHIDAMLEPRAMAAE